MTSGDYTHPKMNALLLITLINMLRLRLAIRSCIMRFAQLKFKQLKPICGKGVQAFVNFGNYDLSIVKNSVYGNKQGLYEIAVSQR